MSQPTQTLTKCSKGAERVTTMTHTPFAHTVVILLPLGHVYQENIHSAHLHAVRFMVHNVAEACVVIQHIASAASHIVRLFFAKNGGKATQDSISLWAERGWLVISSLCTICTPVPIILHSMRLNTDMLGKVRCYHKYCASSPGWCSPLFCGTESP